MMRQDKLQFKGFNSILRERAEKHGGKVYIESPDQSKNITYEQTYAWCNRIANFLKERSVKSDDKITIIGPNSIETLLIFLGVLNYGAIISPINVEESEENFRRLVGVTNPKIVFYSQELAFNPGKYTDGLGISYSNFDVDSEQENELFSTLKSYSPVFESPLGGKDDIAEVVFTSGTTEMPKGVVMTRESLFFQTLEPVERLVITDQDVILDYRSYNWASPQELSILSSLMTGATLVFPRKFSRTRFPSWLKDYKVTIAAGVPTVFNFLLEEKVPLHKKDVPALRFMTSSSSGLPPKKQLEFEEKYGILVNQAAGMSEAGWLAINDPEELKHPERRKIGSIGKALPRKEVLIFDDDGNRCKAGEIGEIVIRGKATALGYLQPNGEINRLLPEGEIHTGDFGYIDSDGYVYITGRKKDLIIRGGVNISPLEVTDWLLQHPDVQEAATIGIPDEIRGEEVASFIVPKTGHKIDQETIVNHCKKKLPDFKLPKTVDILKEIPKTERQKVSKAELLKIWEKLHKKN
jgi:long-chain acyl-CoA synthetase